MARKRRNLHEDSNDPDVSAPLAKGASRAAGGAARAKKADPAAKRRTPFQGLALPPSFFGARALFLLLNLGVEKSSLRLTFVGARKVEDAAIEAVFKPCASRIERRAPRVYDVELPSDRLEELVLEHHDLFRRVDAPGWLFGEVVEAPNDRAEVTVAMDEPLTGARKGDLGRLGFHIVGEGPGELRGVVLGRDLAELTAAPWLGPIEIRKVHPPKG
jgi:hypothetical protein